MTLLLGYVFGLLPILGYLIGSSLNAVSLSMAAERGAGHPMSLLLLVPTYAGHLFAGKLLGWIQRNSKDKDEATISQYGPATFSNMLFHVLLHVASSTLYGAAVSLAGSSLYQVCYASAPVFSIIYSKILLGKNTSTRRIMAVFVIIIGLVARVYVASATVASNEVDDSNANSTSPFIGALLTFACAAGFSLGNILTERALNPPESSGLKKIKGADYLVALGGYGLLLGGIGANLVWTWPRWEELVVLK